MGERVEYNIEDIRAFRAALERFADESEALKSMLDGAVSATAAEWQDSQFEKASERALEASGKVSAALGALYPDAMAFLDRQEEWHAEYTS
ncbi:MAG: hypothetical protein IK066_13015 [Kiritimatiellae bacterium]|nr:hypothetical protein [Kiritimatiellia bacterium]